MIKAVIIESPNRAIVRDVPYPEPGSNEVTIHVMRCGICGTDLHIFSGSMAVNHTYRPALDWMGAGRFDVQALISKSIRIEDVPGFLSGGKASNLMKVQISFEQENQIQ
ncbi:MAG: hypothetical protein ACYCYO_06710 [Bacilli bacterium]